MKIKKLKQALQRLGDLYCCHCGAENPQGKKDYENHTKESEQLENQEQESEN